MQSHRESHCFANLFKYIIFKNPFEQRYPAWVDNVASRSHRLVNENPNTRHEIPPQELLVRETPMGSLPLVLVAHQNQMVRPATKDTMHLDCKRQKSQARTEMETPFLLGSFQYWGVLCRMSAEKSQLGTLWVIIVPTRQYASMCMQYNLLTESEAHTKGEHRCRTL